MCALVMTSSFKRLIESLASPKGPGPSTTFSMFHIFYALELIAKNPIGRNKLAKKMKVGEGAVRTIISRLRDSGLIATSKEGCVLTEKGIRVWQNFESVFPRRVEIKKTALTTSDYSYSFLVKNKGDKVKSGIDQRDAAIMGGAKRAIVIVFKSGRLKIDSVSDSVKKDFPEAAGIILEKLNPEENDVIIIAGANSPFKAKRGAFAASWVLISNEVKS
jgi:predicted transcriptional regulator